MFVRIKKSNNRKNTAIQLVEGIRDPITNKVKQTVVRHIGSASDEAEIAKLIELGEFIKAEIEASMQPNFLSSDTLATIATDSKKISQIEEQDYKIDDIRKLQQESRTILGIHEVYGKIYDNLGFNKILYNPARQLHAQNIIRNITLARIANPQSKRESVNFLASDYGIDLKLDSVYNSMDKIDDHSINKIQSYATCAAQTLFPEKIDVLFYDATTLYFESFTEDELRSKGFSKEHKFNETQILLSIFVTKKGIPIGWEIFPGSTYEGHTLLQSLEGLKKRFSIDNIIFVADSGMLNEENLGLLEEAGYKYIVGARIKNMGKCVTKELLDKEGYVNFAHNEDQYRGKIISIPQESAPEDKKTVRNLVVTYSEKRARKDENDRTKALRKLTKMLNKSHSIKPMVGANGWKKYLQIEGDSTVGIDFTKIEAAIVWDGLHGVITNIEDPNICEVMDHYRGLWQVEETFRVSKHDIKIRPIYHWNPERIKAHVAICFMALVCIRHLEYRVSLREKLSPERIRKALTSVDVTKVRHVIDKRVFGIPSKASVDAKIIYKAMDLSLNSTPYLISK